MKELIAYELYRNKKFLIFLFGFMFIFNTFLYVLTQLVQLDVEKIFFVLQVLTNIVLFVILLDRRSTFMGRDLVFKNKSQMLLIPFKASSIVTANYIMMLGELILFSTIFYIFTIYPINKDVDTLEICLIFFFAIIAVSTIGNALFIWIGKKKDTEIVAASITGMLMLVISVPIIVIIFKAGSVILFYFYSVHIYYLTCIFLIILIGYTMNCRLAEHSRRNNKKRSGKWIVLMLLLIIGFFFAGQGITYANRIIDNVDIPFESDEQVIGKWHAIDFIENQNGFDPANKAWRGELYVKDLQFNEQGTTNWQYVWTKGFIINEYLNTTATYTFQEVNGKQYLLMEWKTGDYVYRHMKPWYYVFEKVD